MQFPGLGLCTCKTNGHLLAGIILITCKNKHKSELFHHSTFQSTKMILYGYGSFIYVCAE